MSKKLKEEVSLIHAHLDEVLSQVRTVRHFAMDSEEARRYADQLARTSGICACGYICIRVCEYMYMYVYVCTYIRMFTVHEHAVVTHDLYGCVVSQSLSLDVSLEFLLH